MKSCLLSITLAGICRPACWPSIVASDAIKKSPENTKSNQKTTGWLQARVDTNPLRPAEYRYVHEHGAEHLNQVVEMLFEEFFPSN